MVKRVIVLLFIIPFVLAGAKAVSAGQRVFDQAALLTAEETQLLEEDISTLAEQSRLDIAVVTTDDAEGKNAREYADDFYDDNGFGMGEQYDGLLLLIDMDHREVYISTSGRAIGIFTDARIDAMTDTSVSFLAEQDYMGAAEAFLDDVRRYAAAESDDSKKDEGTAGNPASGATLPARPSQPAQTDHALPTLAEILVYAVIALAAGGIFCGVTYSRYRSPKHNPPYPYSAKGELDLTSQEDVFVNQYITQQRIPDPPSNSGRSGGSSTHVSRSGRTHGGGGKRF